MNESTECVGTRLLFENDRVRIWDLALAPGKSLEKHVHRLDYVILVESGGLIRSADPDDPASPATSSSRMTRSRSGRSPTSRSTTG